MKFSLRFVEELFHSVPAPARVAELLTMAGLEVGSVIKQGDDFVFDAEVTPNRYDWLSIFGVAHELACLCGQKLMVRFPSVKKTPAISSTNIHIEDKSDCPVYVARLLHHTAITSSPVWLKTRIGNCGINIVNNAVDITNYCMLKWGNPLHAFDFDKIEGDIFVRRAKNGERFIGLDNKERVLSPGNLVISDEKKVIALAGVMGAKNTEVGPETKNILLEAAVFSPLAVRRSRRSAGIETDSSYRFERSVSRQLLEYASSDAVTLMEKLCHAVFAGYRHAGARSVDVHKNITVDISRLNHYLGSSVGLSPLRRILKNLGFEVSILRKGVCTVRPPFFRLDIKRDVDVFEEVARIFGYNRIQETLPFLLRRHNQGGVYNFKKSLRDFLLRLGLNEVITNSLTSGEALSALGEIDLLTLMNPLRSQEDALRTTLLPGLLDTIAYNCNQKNNRLRVFEIAHTYRKAKHGFSEKQQLALGVSENGGGFAYLKGVIKALMGFLNISDYVLSERGQKNFLNALEIVYRGRCLGFLGKVNAAVQSRWNIKDEIYFSEIDLEALIPLKTDPAYRQFSRYPVISRDLSLQLDAHVTFSRVQEIILTEAVGHLVDYRIVDVYKERHLLNDPCMFTLRIFYGSSEKTLTAQEVDGIHSRLREKFSSCPGISLR